MIQTPTLFQVAEVQLVYKQKFKPSDRPKITSSKDAYSILLQVWNKEIMCFIEDFKILLLNRANRVIGCFEVSTGGMCSTVVDPRVLFAAAIKGCASSIVLAHNHPSGNLNPSQADINITHQLIAAGKVLDIKIIEHIILSEDGYYSFADEGLI